MIFECVASAYKSVLPHYAFLLFQIFLHAQFFLVALSKIIAQNICTDHCADHHANICADYCATDHQAEVNELKHFSHLLKIENNTSFFFVFEIGIKIYSLDFTIYTAFCFT